MIFFFISLLHLLMRFPFAGNLSRHFSHWNGFVCVHLCAVSCAAVDSDLAHTSHSYRQVGGEDDSSWRRREDSSRSGGCWSKRTVAAPVSQGEDEEEEASASASPSIATSSFGVISSCSNEGLCWEEMGLRFTCKICSSKSIFRNNHHCSAFTTSCSNIPFHHPRSSHIRSLRLPGSPSFFPEPPLLLLRPCCSFPSSPSPAFSFSPEEGPCWTHPPHPCYGHLLPPANKSKNSTTTHHAFRHRNGICQLFPSPFHVP